MFSTFPQSEIDIVAPDGTVRSTTKAILDSKSATIPDPMIQIQAGDEIRRRIPNGTEEAFEVIEPTYHETFHAIPAHFQVKIRRKGTFPTGTGGNYTINISGSGSRAYIHSTDNSVNQTRDQRIFADIREGIQSAGLSTEEMARITEALKRLENSAGKPEYLSEYQKFIQGGAAYMTILSPFIPALTSLL